MQDDGRTVGSSHRQTDQGREVWEVLGFFRKEPNLVLAGWPGLRSRHSYCFPINLPAPPIPYGSAVGETVRRETRRDSANATPVRETGSLYSVAGTLHELH